MNRCTHANRFLHITLRRVWTYTMQALFIIPSKASALRLPLAFLVHDDIPRIHAAFWQSLAPAVGERASERGSARACLRLPAFLSLSPPLPSLLLQRRKVCETATEWRCCAGSGGSSVPCTQQWEQSALGKQLENAQKYFHSGQARGALTSHSPPLPSPWPGLTPKPVPRAARVCVWLSVTPAGRRQWPGCQPGLRAFLPQPRPASRRCAWYVFGGGGAWALCAPRLMDGGGKSSHSASQRAKRSNLRQDRCAGEREPAMHWPQYFSSACLPEQGHCRRRR